MGFGPDRAHHGLVGPSMSGRVSSFGCLAGAMVARRPERAAPVASPGQAVRGATSSAAGLCTWAESNRINTIVAGFNVAQATDSGA